MFHIKALNGKIIYSCELPEEIEKQDYQIQQRFAIEEAINNSSTDFFQAELEQADFSHLKISHTNFSEADLSEADFTGSTLYNVNLYQADLQRAIFKDTIFEGTTLEVFKQDTIAEILKLPQELEFLRAAIIEGKIDGSSYNGKCSCLSGTLARACEQLVYFGGRIVNPIPYYSDANSPREKWFFTIKEGDTPETNSASAAVLSWVNEAIAIRNNILKAYK